MKIGNYETHPAADLFPMLDEERLASLAADIKARGLMQPVVLLRGLILDGRNRLAACLRAGVAPRMVEYTGGDPWRAVWSLNAERRQIEDKIRLSLIAAAMLCGSEEWEAAQRAAELAANKARSVAAEAQHKVSNPRAGEKRPESGRASHEAQPKQPPPTRDSAAKEANKTATKIAAAAGVSRATVERALSLPAKVQEQVKAGEVVGATAFNEARRAERVEKITEIAKGNAPLPVGRSASRYPVIYADPPWRYEHVETESRAIENHYPTMDLDAICALKVSDLATPDAVLFMWATSPKLAEAMRVVGAWGFTYRTCMVWVKDKIGMGYYARQRHELLLIATRGAPPVPLPANRPDSVIDGVRAEHSAKPAAFAEAIERMYPDFPRVELFCRSPRFGWDVWGNQADAA